MLLSFGIVFADCFSFLFAVFKNVSKILAKSFSCRNKLVLRELRVDQSLGLIWLSRF